MPKLSLPERLYESNPEKYRKIPSKLYVNMHRLMPLICVDCYIIMENERKKGILLVKRKERPAKGLWWPVGGRRPRGVKREKAIIEIAKRETGLDVKVIAELGTEDTMFDECPERLNHGEGTDTTNTVFVVKPYDINQEVICDSTVSRSRVITLDEYLAEKGKFHPYVEKYLPKAFESLIS